MATALVDAENDNSPPPTPPRQTERQKKAAEEQKARNEAKVIADLNAKLAAANAQLKLALEKIRRGKSQAVVNRRIRGGGRNCPTRLLEGSRCRYFASIISVVAIFLTVCPCTGKGRKA